MGVNSQSVGCSRGAGLDDEFLAERAKRSLDAGDGGAVAGVQHASHSLLVDAESLGEGDAGEAGIAKRERECGLGRGAGGDGDVMFSGASGAGYRDGIGAVDSPGDGLLKGVGCLGQGFGLVGTGGQALGQVAERDDELAGGVGSQSRGIGESHGGLLLGSPEIVPTESELTNHGRQEPEVEVLPAVFDDGEAVAVVEGDVAALAALGVDADGDATLAADLAHPVDELPAFHGSYLRSVVSELSSSVSVGIVLLGRCLCSHDSRANEDRRSDRMGRQRLARAIRAGALSCVMGATAAVAIAQDGSEDACPRAALRQMMSLAARHDAIADVAALELEVLRMCVERQELIREIVEGDRKLAGFRGSSTGATPVPAALTGTPVGAGDRRSARYQGAVRRGGDGWRGAGRRNTRGAAKDRGGVEDRGGRERE